MKNEPINNVQLAFPCKENLGQMTKSQKGKLCAKCSAYVIDFTDKNTRDLEKTLIQAPSLVCGIFKKSQLAGSFSKYAATAIIVSASSALPAASQETEALDSIPDQNSIEINDDFFGYIVETMPQMIGGLEQFYENLNSHLKFPQGLNQKVKVFIQFDVDTLGNMTEIKIIKGFSPEIDREALRAVQQMNQKFSPGTQRGKPVSVRMSFPITFDPRKN